MATTWDTARASGNAIVFSNGNLTASYTGATGDRTAYSTTSKRSDRWCWRLVVNSINGNAVGPGFGNAAALNSGNDMANTADGVEWVGTGPVNINALTVATIGAWVPGATPLSGIILWLAIDIKNKLFYGKIGNGYWNNSVSCNPDTASGGVSLATLNAGPYFAGADIGYSGDNVTGDFISPSGLATFAPWDVQTFPFEVSM